jgi:hypothetical protein
MAEYIKRFTRKGGGTPKLCIETTVSQRVVVNRTREEAGGNLSFSLASATHQHHFFPAIISIMGRTFSVSQLL